jgi:hypothetical protein
LVVHCDAGHPQYNRCHASTDPEELATGRQAAFRNCVSCRRVAAGRSLCRAECCLGKGASHQHLPALRQGCKGRKGTDFKIGYFHSSLVELVDTDIKAAGSGIPAAGEGDPICDCQEWDGFFVLKMDVTMETPQRAQAVVSFAIITPKNRPKDDSRTVKITLISERGEWRIYDIEYLAEPYSDPAAPKSFRQQIQKDIDFYAHQPKS